MINESFYKQEEATENDTQPTQMFFYELQHDANNNKHCFGTKLKKYSVIALVDSHLTIAMLHLPFVLFR